MPRQTMISFAAFQRVNLILFEGVCKLLECRWSLVLHKSSDVTIPKSKPESALLKGWQQMRLS